MDNGFFRYMEFLELMTFFSGYPLVYFLIHFVSEASFTKRIIHKNFVSFLPLAYAAVGLLYLGLQLKNLYPNYSLYNIQFNTHEPFLKIWALLSLLFLLPVFRRKTVWSLLHSLVFFFFLALKIYSLLTQPNETGGIKNEMNVYSISLLIHLIVLMVLVIAVYLMSVFKAKQAK